LEGNPRRTGDLLLHIVFYAKIEPEQNQFTLQEAINGICDKLIARHPHIYGDVIVKDEEDVKRLEKLKLKRVNNRYWVVFLYHCLRWLKLFVCRKGKANRL
jgi:XTP/dITP diphosphohydrolase